MSQLSQEEKLAIFRKELFDEGILKEGDSIGTDDETLKRFLRARKYDLVQAKKMFRDAQHWRQTVEGVGIDELYKQIDPFDYPERKDVFECWPMWFHKTDKVWRTSTVKRHNLMRKRLHFRSFCIARPAPECSLSRRNESQEVVFKMRTGQALANCTCQR
ncbi:hypothetical protein PM082_017425 [Marasmius tenuissimus]|nr:hypothetical protein PM082_017425 [Marasmius tenuissimus]